MKTILVLLSVTDKDPPNWPAITLFVAVALFCGILYEGWRHRFFQLPPEKR